MKNLLKAEAKEWYSAKQVFPKVSSAAYLITGVIDEEDP